MEIVSASIHHCVCIGQGCMRTATGAVGPRRQNNWAEKPRAMACRSHAEPHLQQFVDDGGLVGGVDAVAVAQAQDGHLQDADEATSGSAPFSMLEA